MMSRTINIGDWQAKIFFCYNQYVESVLERSLTSIHAPIDIIVRMRVIARDDEYNTGFTFSNAKMRRSVVVVGKTTSAREFMNTFVHEVRHLADDIASADGISLRGEDVAYLSGGIAASLCDIVGEFTCPKCQKNAHVGKMSAITKHKKNANH